MPLIYRALRFAATRLFFNYSLIVRRPMNTPLQAFDPFGSLSRAITGLDPPPVLQWLTQIRKRDLVMRLGNDNALCTCYSSLGTAVVLPLRDRVGHSICYEFSKFPPTDRFTVHERGIVAYSRSHFVCCLHSNSANYSLDRREIIRIETILYLCPEWNMMKYRTGGSLAFRVSLKPARGRYWRKRMTTRVGHLSRM